MKKTQQCGYETRKQTDREIGGGFQVEEESSKEKEEQEHADKKEDV